MRDRRERVLFYVQSPDLAPQIFHSPITRRILFDSHRLTLIVASPLNNPQKCRTAT